MSAPEITGASASLPAECLDRMGAVERFAGHSAHSMLSLLEHVLHTVQELPDGFVSFTTALKEAGR
jgi:hypothetical protein